MLFFLDFTDLYIKNRTSHCLSFITIRINHLLSKLDENIGLKFVSEYKLDEKETDVI